MKQVQIIEIDELGLPSGLVHKNGLDLTKFGGKQEVVRASDIKWDSTHSKWFVSILVGVAGGKVLTTEVYSMTGRLDHTADTVSRQGVLLFNDYSDAVLNEVKFFNGIDLLKTTNSEVHFASIN